MTPRGETLVEVTISLLLLAVGAMALAAGITRAKIDRRAAHEAGRSVIAAESWLERWRVGATPAGRGTGAGVEAISDPPGRLRWSVERPAGCLLEATVEVEAEGRGVVARLVTRRFVDGGGCEA